MSSVNPLTPRDLGCFCHNKECPCFAMHGFPDDYAESAEVDFGAGPKELQRFLVQNTQTNRTAWLCGACKNAADIATGRTDPEDMPISMAVNSGILLPN